MMSTSLEKGNKSLEKSKPNKTVLAKEETKNGKEKENGDAKEETAPTKEKEKEKEKGKTPKQTKKNHTGQSGFLFSRKKGSSTSDNKKADMVHFYPSEFRRHW